MKVEPLNCAQLRNGFVDGRVPAGPEVDAHLRDCPHCRELFEEGAQLGRALAQGAPPLAELEGLRSVVERDLLRETGLRAGLRALPLAVRSGLLVAFAVGLFAVGLGFGRRQDFAEFSVPVFVAVVAVLLGAFVAAALRIGRGLTVATGSSARERSVALLYLALPALASLLVPLGASPEAREAWGRPELCFFYGALFVSPLLLLCWLFERRDRVPLATLASVGALAGIAANLLLCAHCSSAHLGHLLLAHASIGAAWATALGGAARLLGAR